MADTFYGISLGAGADPVGAVTKAASTTSLDIELRVTTAVTGIVDNKSNLLAAVETLERYIAQDVAPL